MSPEQIQGERGDPRSDIYAWGVMMYEFLTGERALRGRQLARGHGRPHAADARSGSAPSAPEVSPALEAVVLKAMRRYPENRYQSAEELLADLDHLDALDVSSIRPLPGEAPWAGCPPPGRRGALWGYIALIALGFIAALVLVVVISVVIQR